MEIAEDQPTDFITCTARQSSLPFELKTDLAVVKALGSVLRFCRLFDGEIIQQYNGDECRESQIAGLTPVFVSG
jgi:hypothetical protein